MEVAPSPSANFCPQQKNRLLQPFPFATLCPDLCTLLDGLARAEVGRCWRKPAGSRTSWFACGGCGRGSKGSKREDRRRGSTDARCTCRMNKTSKHLNFLWQPWTTGGGWWLIKPGLGAKGSCLVFPWDGRSVLERWAFTKWKWSSEISKTLHCVWLHNIWASLKEGKEQWMWWVCLCSYQFNCQQY